MIRRATRRMASAAMLKGATATAALAILIPGTVLAEARDVLIAGDIAQGKPQSQEAATADLVASRAGLVMTAGDNAYPVGSMSDFQEKYHPTWGRFRDRTRPTPGNHDYDTPGAAGYFDYFGRRAGPRAPNGNGRGYYAFRLRSWLVLALDSEACGRAAGCGKGSPQYAWVDRTLEAVDARCTLAVWHKPVFSSADRATRPVLRPLFSLLYRHGVELLVTGHDHFYERMAPARPDGTVDRRFGIRQFIVGTGGATLLDGRDRVAPLSRAFQSTVHGVLRLRLRWRSYEWAFLPIAGQSYEDRGSADCHGRP